tara:strand:- start:264 stop:587 length:324 start_codon:yes stop_codon:yes gene_type:complete
MSWQDILKGKRMKLIGSALRQTISNHLEETGRKDVYEFEEIISLFPKYIEITEQPPTSNLKGKFEQFVMRYIPDGYGKLKELLTDKQGYAIPSSIQSAITGWEKLRE